MPMHFTLGSCADDAKLLYAYFCTVLVPALLDYATFMHDCKRKRSASYGPPVPASSATLFVYVCEGRIIVFIFLSGMSSTKNPEPT